MFKAFRLLGCVAAGIPCATLKSGSKTIVFISVGHSWQAYDCDTLRVVLIGPKFERKIRALACDGSLIFAAIRGGIEVCRRVERIFFRPIDEDLTILQMLHLGPLLICLLDNDSILTLNTASLGDEPIRSFHLDEGFRAACMTHLDTYVNKILIGGENGKLELRNFITGEKLYSFLNNWTSSIRHLEPAPALDVVGISLSNGSILLFNVRCNEVLFKFETSRSQESKTVHSCTALAFTSGVTTPLLASGGMDGEIMIWDLDQQELLCSKKDAHANTVLSLMFFPSSFRLMSLADDNSVKQWTVDLQSKELRLLRQRCGPRSPPALLKFAPDGLRIFACDKESSLWSISTIQDQQTRELSSKKANLSSRPLGLDASWVRERDWGNILSVHDGQKSPFLWNSKKFCLEKNSFVVSGLIKGSGTKNRTSCLQATAVAFSQCGNFGLVGYQSGALHKFNVQSGLHRGSIPQQGTAHKDRIVSLASDQLNRRILSAGFDGWLRIWDFKSHSLLHEQFCSSGIALMTVHNPNSLVGVGLEDFRIQIFDFEFYRTVRKLQGVKDRITGMQISHDGKWLMVSAMDRSLIVFDIPSANQIQILFFKTPVLSFSLSDSLEVLATAHVNQRGVSLWVNQCLFGAKQDPISSMEVVPVLSSEMESGERLMKLAMTPVSNWKVQYGSSIKERLQVIKPQKNRPAAPFFLPPLISANAPEQSSVTLMEVDNDPVNFQVESTMTSEFMKQLQKFKSDGEQKTFLEFLKKQSVVYIEQEIVSLTREVSLELGDEIQLSDLEDLSIFLDFLELSVESEQDIEFVQVLLKMVLQMKCSILIAVDPLVAKIIRIQDKLEKQWLKLESLLQSTQCLVSVFSGLHE